MGRAVTGDTVVRVVVGTAVVGAWVGFSNKYPANSISEMYNVGLVGSLVSVNEILYSEYDSVFAG